MPDTEPTTRLDIISKGKNGRYYLDHVEVKAKDTGASIFIKVQQLCLSSTKPLNWLFVLYDPVVYTATAMTAKGSNDTEAQTCEVFIKSKRYSEACTLALRQPAEIDKTTPDFLTNRSQFGANRGSDQVIYALLVIQEIRRAKVVIVFGALSLLSFSIGLVAGLMSGKAELGIAVTAGLFQFLTILQWSYIWATGRGVNGW